VTVGDGVRPCLIRVMAHDLDAALCPTRQTPGTGNLEPPMKRSDGWSEEFIRNSCKRRHVDG
jgi:hypothetical protein